MANSPTRPGRWKKMTERERLFDETPFYPCCVCHEEFRSLRQLRMHPHPTKEKPRG